MCMCMGMYVQEDMNIASLVFAVSWKDLCACMGMCMCKCICICMRMCMYTHVWYVYVYVYVYVYAYVYVYPCLKLGEFAGFDQNF
jgi:hypothetical protein